MLTGPVDPPVKVLFVYNCNPLATAPHQNRVRQGLEREDLFTVVFDQVMTDTARYADVVLPATTFLEQYDFARAYGPISLQLVRPVIDAVGEARPNVDVFAELEERLGLGQPDEPTRRTRDDAPRPRRAARRRGRRAPRRRAGGAALRRRARSSSSTCFRTRRTARSTCFPRTSIARRRSACIAYQPDPATDRLSAGAHLAVEREGDHVDARRTRTQDRPRSRSTRTMPTRGRSGRATPSASSTTSAR